MIVLSRFIGAANGFTVTVVDGVFAVGNIDIRFTIQRLVQQVQAVWLRRMQKNL